jgi:hypothetical protein
MSTMSLAHMRVLNATASRPSAPSPPQSTRMASNPSSFTLTGPMASAAGVLLLNRMAAATAAPADDAKR